MALCLGFSLPDNFRFPYAAIGFSDFWRRWHISLSTWLRDYLYIPLGGSRVRLPRHLANVMVTFVISGLWPGANWTFIAWGALHGCISVVDRLRDRLFRVKGFVNVAGDQRRGYLELAGGRLELRYGEPWADTPPQNELVFIGEGLDEATLRRQLWSCRARQA